MIHFITDLNNGNLINLTHVAKAVKLQGGELFELRSALDDFIGTARLWQLENLIVQIIPADGWEIIEKHKIDGAWKIDTTPVVCFGLFANGNFKPITGSDPDSILFANLYWRHKSSSKILNPFRVLEDEAEFLNDGGGDE